MIQSTRYEEYLTFENGLPFTLNANLKRTRSRGSREANWHENPEIQVCTNGKGFVLLDGEKYVFEKGAVVVVKPNQLHYTGTDDFLEYSCLIVDPTFLQTCGIELFNYAFLPCFSNEKIVELFKETERVYMAQSEERKAQLCIKVLQIFLCLCENYSTKKNKGKSECEEGASATQTVKRAIEYVRGRIGEKITLEKIAKAVYCDKYALTRVFKKVTGQTVVSYINALRCRIAASQIASGTSVTESALNCGFENLSYFSKTFRKFMGKLPSDYKRDKNTVL
jgi:AraC-like DNA-binding protein